MYVKIVFKLYSMLNVKFKDTKVMVSLKKNQIFFHKGGSFCSRKRGK